MDDTMPRQKKYPEQTLIRLAEGSFEKIKGLLLPTEDRTDFFREAVEREIKRRERLAKRGK